MIQAAAGFFAYFIIMAENGFLPTKLFGIRKQWDSKGVNDLEDSYGQEWVRKVFRFYSLLNVFWWNLNKPITNFCIVSRPIPTVRSSSSPVTLLSLCPLWLYSGLIWSSVRQDVIPSSTKEWSKMFLHLKQIHNKMMELTTKIHIFLVLFRNWVLNFGLVFETCLAALLSYCPGMDTALRMYPLK